MATGGATAVVCAAQRPSERISDRTGDFEELPLSGRPFAQPEVLGVLNPEGTPAEGVSGVRREPGAVKKLTSLRALFTPVVRVCRTGLPHPSNPS